MPICRRGSAFGLARDQPTCEHVSPMLHGAYWCSGRDGQRPPMEVHLMPRSSGGRVVVEVDPELKKRLYAALSLDGTTLKDWLIQEVERYLESHAGLVQDHADAPRTRGGK